MLVFSIIQIQPKCIVLMTPAEFEVSIGLLPTIRVPLFLFVLLIKKYSARDRDIYENNRQNTLCFYVHLHFSIYLIIEFLRD